MFSIMENNGMPEGAQKKRERQKGGRGGERGEQAWGGSQARAWARASGPLWRRALTECILAQQAIAAVAVVGGNEDVKGPGDLLIVEQVGQPHVHSKEPVCWHGASRKVRVAHVAVACQEGGPLGVHRVGRVEREGLHVLLLPCEERVVHD
jgi:hypothetical protein